MMTMQRPTTLIEAELTHLPPAPASEPASTPMSHAHAHTTAWMLMLHGRLSSPTRSNRPQQTPDRPSRRRQVLLHQLAHAHGHAPARPRPAHSAHHVLARTCDHHRPPVSRALPAGRDRIRQAHHRRPAPPRLLHGGRRPLRHPPRPTTLLSFYAAPIGDPAIGPTAYPHRLSASENPIAALGHHQEDSTHIAFNVLTAGFTWRWLRFEESGFHGGEPTESAGASSPPPTASPSTATPPASPSRPTPNWSSQYSIAHIVSPEASTPTKTSSARPHPSCTTAPSALTATPHHAPACRAWT